MAVQVTVVTEGVHDYIAPGLIDGWSGVFTAQAKITGTGVAGQVEMYIRPHAPTTRLYKIEQIKYEVEVGILGGLGKINFWHPNLPESFQLIGDFDSSSAGLFTVELPLGLFWRSKNNDENLISVYETNIDTRVQRLWVQGRFFDESTLTESPAGRFFGDGLGAIPEPL